MPSLRRVKLSLRRLVVFTDILNREKGRAVSTLYQGLLCFKGAKYFKKNDIRACGTGTVEAERDIRDERNPLATYIVNNRFSNQKMFKNTHFS